MSEKEAVQRLPAEWSYMVRAEHVEKGPMVVEISPSAQEVSALLSRLGVEDILSMNASFTLRRNNMVIHVQGHIKGVVTQLCVVSGDAINAEIDETFEGWYADSEQAVSIAKARRDKQREQGHTEFPILEEHEDPEAIIDGQIDLGELATQYIVLTIDLYPHAPGVVYENGDDLKKNDPSISRKNPFAALKDWKDKL